MTEREPLQETRDDAFEQATVDSFAAFCDEHGLNADDRGRLASRVSDSLFATCQEDSCA